MYSHRTLIRKWLIKKRKIKFRKEFSKWSTKRNYKNIRVEIDRKIKNVWKQLGDYYKF